MCASSDYPLDAAIFTLFLMSSRTDLRKVFLRGKIIACLVERFDRNQGMPEPLRYDMLGTHTNLMGANSLITTISDNAWKLNFPCEWRPLLRR